MQTLCSIVIPVSRKHLGVVHEAIASAEHQTIPCEIIVEYDHEGRGAAATRNAAIQRSSGLFFIPLDADDLLQPDYVESCLQAYQPGHYVYTHWIEDGVKHTVEPCEEWHAAGLYHYITTLIPRAMFDDVGGFDTAIPALEDNDFFQHARAKGWHGVLNPVHGWEYRRRLGQSNTNPNATDPVERAAALKAATELIKQRYARYWRYMSCCGAMPRKGGFMNEKHEGDVQAYPLFTQRGRGVEGKITLRWYENPRTKTPMWVDPRDVQARPQDWELVPDVSAISPDVATVESLVRAALAPKPQPTQQRVEDVYQEVSKPTETPAPKPVEKPKAPPPKRNKTRRPTGKKSA